MKVLLDSNVIVSAFGTQGLCSEVFAYCLAEHEIITSRFIIDEVIASLEEDFGMSAKTARAHRQFLLEETKAAVPLNLPRSVCRDPKDAKILGAAFSARVDIIITGNKDLLELKEFKGSVVMTVREFWEKRKGLEGIT